MHTYPLHPAAALFPAMDDAAFAALVADIAAHGQREPIVLWHGQVIDGRHRLRACEQLGIEPQVRDVSAEVADPVTLVVSLNLHRRHLSESQRAMVAAKLANLKAGNPRFKGANLHDWPPSVSAATAAQMLNVSERLVKAARQVRAHGAPELVAAVEADALAVSTAAPLARLPAETQRDILTKTPEEIRAIAREVKARIDEAGVCGPSAVKLFDRVAAEHQLSGAEQLAVVHAYQAELPPLPTPSEARRLANERQCLVLGSDGHYHGPDVTPEQHRRAELWLQLRAGLESLASIEAPVEALLACIPSYQHTNLTRWLARATPLVNRLNLAWQEHTHA